MRSVKAREGIFHLAREIAKQFSHVAGPSTLRRLCKSLRSVSTSTGGLSDEHLPRSFHDIELIHHSINVYQTPTVCWGAQPEAENNQEGQDLAPALSELAVW